MVTPEPAHHLRQNRAAHFLAMFVDAPRVVHVVALGAQPLHHANVLIEPVEGLVVGGVAGSLPAVIVPPVAEKNANRLLFASADDFRVSIAAAQIHKTAHITQHLAKFIGTLPRHSESRNRTGAGPANAMAFRI